MLTLLAPNFADTDSVWRHPLPFALWPVGHQSLLAHWMDEAVRLKKNTVRIYASDRPAEIRQHLDGGGYWSCAVEVIPIKRDDAAPTDAIRVDRLPQQGDGDGEISSPSELLARWQAMQNFWLTNRDSHAVSIDVEVVPGGWVGPHAKVHPTARLEAPFWIGANAKIGAGCHVGPQALIGAGCVLDSAVAVREAVVLAGTYVGPHLSVLRAIAGEGMIVDLHRACRVDIHERFILSSVSERSQGPKVLERIAALTAWICVAPLAFIWPGQKWTQQLVANAHGSLTSLTTGSTGPLIVRRWPWLKRIFQGHLRWFGTLPRGEEDCTHLPADTAEQLRKSAPGMFSWADMHGCHDVTAPDEWIHATYQTTQQDDVLRQTLRRKLLRLAWLNPS